MMKYTLERVIPDAPPRRRWITVLIGFVIGFVVTTYLNH